MSKSNDSAVDLATESETGTAWLLFVVFAASFFSPLIVWVNTTERAELPGFLLLGLSVFAFALGVRWLLDRLRLDRIGGTYAVALFTLCFMSFGSVLDKPFGRTVLLGICLVIAILGYRLSGMRVVRLTIAWGAIALFAYPAVLGALDLGESGKLTLKEPTPLVADFTSERRDIVMIVLDGYGNNHVLADFYDYDNNPFESALRSSNFDVGPGVVANYGRTRFSVSSVLQLDYPVTEGSLTQTDLNHLLTYLGGDNLLSDWLRASGYLHTYVESGWFGTKCEGTIDSCVAGPMPDEAFYDVVHRSLLQGLPGFETGRAFSLGAQQVIAWLDEDLDQLLYNNRPDYIYAHVLLPHPPLFLGADCAMDAQGGLQGFSIAQPGMSDSELGFARERYVAQVQCVSDVLARVATLAEETDSIVIMFGDHGPDSNGQLFVAGAEWDEEQRRERLGAMFAARVPACDMTLIGSLVNAGRRLVSCLSDRAYPDLTTRSFDFEFADRGQMITEIPVPVFES